ncbi:MAG: hypothetical protein QGG36_10040 [Pirellulaceae bacterium]|jgi:putative ABC transport system permease protein|nr:hypothetical protein [Pirellulaceae bacterium]MDP7016130.1 hypothetical protein [Pirellulaceae bacterium]
MNSAIWLASHYLWFYKRRTVTLIVCVAVTVALPFSVRLVVERFERQVRARATSTPLVAGPTGSRFDLAVHALYFDARPTTTPNGVFRRIRSEGLADPFAVFVAGRVRDAPVVGVTVDYLHFRSLRVAQGESIVRLGDCVVGANVARRIRVEPGERILTDPKNPFALSATPPLKMRVRGVLARMNTPDDDAVFVDLKTAWLIAGLGHGHEPAEQVVGEGALLDSSEEEIVLGGAVKRFLEVTDDNIDSFHFHNAVDKLPLSAIIVVPRDQKSRTVLLGRFVDDPQTQLIEPAAVVDRLMERVFRAQRFFDMLSAVLIVVTAALVALVTSLTRRMREREFETLVKLGCSRFLQTATLWSELVIILTLAAGLAAILTAAAGATTPQLIQSWLMAT